MMKYGRTNEWMNERDAYAMAMHIPQSMEAFNWLFGIQYYSKRYCILHSLDVIPYKSARTMDSWAKINLLIMKICVCVCVDLNMILRKTGLRIILPYLWHLFVCSFVRSFIFFLLIWLKRQLRCCIQVKFPFAPSLLVD